MGQVLHGSATTTEAVRRTIQHSQESLRVLAKRHGINQKTVAKWKRRTFVADLPTGPKDARSTVLTVEEEAVVIAFRRHTLLPLDDCLYALQPTIPHLTRSSLHRCRQRHGVSRLPQVEGEVTAKRKFKTYAIGYFHIDIAEVRTEQGKLYMLVAIDRTSKLAFVELHEKALRRTAADFLRRLAAAVPYKIHTVLTDNGTHFTTPGNVSSAAPDIKAAIEAGETVWAHAFRVCQRPVGHRPSAHQAATSVDQRPSRADEPHHQGRHRQGLPLRRPGEPQGPCPGLHHSLQLRQAPQGPAVANALPGHLRGDLPPKKWTGLSRSALGLGWADVAQG